MRRESVLAVAKPILFNTDMVRAIQDGTKTVTRRLIKPQPKYSESGGFAWKGREYGTDLPPTIQGAACNFLVASPYQIGDILYVRETWTKGCIVGSRKFHYVSQGERSDIIFKEECQRNDIAINDVVWKPSIHMPKEAARIFLRVTNVRVERLQDMTEEDAFMEGFSGVPWCAHSVFENYPDSPIPCEAATHSECPLDPPCNHSIPELFGSDIWDKTVKKSDLAKYGWAANPWVWVIEFEKVEVAE